LPSTWAVSVAAGTPGLRRFAVAQPGRVLLYAAEDASYIVRRRLDGICAAGVDLAALALELVEPQAPPPAAPQSVDDRILAALAQASQPQPFADLRAVCRVRTATLYQRLAALANVGRIAKSADGYRLIG
jgi:hypothetical protein